MGIESEFVAVTIIDTTLDGLPGTFSNAKSIFKPLFSKAVMDGKPTRMKRWVRTVYQWQDEYFICNNNNKKRNAAVEIWAISGKFTQQDNKE